MSVFQEESNLDSASTYSHLAQPATRGPSDSVWGTTNPFGGGDGFAGTPETRSVANSVSAVETPQPTPLPPQPQSQTQPAAANPYAASSMPPPSAAGPSSSPAGSSNPFSNLSDVSTSPPDRLAVVAAALPSYSLDNSAELDDRHSKHGKIVVGEPEIRGGKLRSYHVYRVSSAAGTVEHVFRRYSDFVWLRTVLVKSFPGVFIPPLPEKKVLGNKENAFVESRRIDLQRWLQRVVVRQFLAEHESVSLFLHRATASFDDEAKALQKSTEAKPTHEIVSLYMDLFPELARLPANDKANDDVDALAEFLKNSEIKMNALQAAADKFVATDYASVQELAKVNSALQANYELEKVFVASPPPSVQARSGVLPRVDIADSLGAWHLSAKWSNNAVDDLVLSPLKFELQDIQSMVECVRIRTELMQKWQKSVKVRHNATATPQNAVLPALVAHSRLPFVCCLTQAAAKWSTPAGQAKNEKVRGTTNRAGCCFSPSPIRAHSLFVCASLCSRVARRKPRKRWRRPRLATKGCCSISSTSSSCTRSSNRFDDGTQGR